MSYFSDPAHATWQRHYLDGSFGGRLLAFTEAWKLANLPPQGEHNGLRYRLFDVERNWLLPELSIYTALEHEDRLERCQIQDENWDCVTVHTLMSYWYGCHHCPCHRKQDAERFVDDILPDCEGDRFQIHSIYPPGRPQLVLYSETLPEEELERILLAHG